MYRLFFWCEEFFSIGGCQIALQRQIRELLRRGHEVTVGSSDASGPLTFGPEPGFNHLRLSAVSDIYGVMGASQTKQSGPPFDLMYVQRVFKSGAEAHLEVLRRLSPAIPTLVRVTTLGDLAALAPLRSERYLAGVAGFISLSEALSLEILEMVPGAVIFGQRNGVCRGEVSPGRFSTGGPYVFIGRLSPTKGIDLLMEGWPIYRELGGARDLLIFGTPKAGYGQPELQDPAFMRRHGVTFAQGGERVWEQVGRAFALVKPSRTEGHCNTMLEAMAAGVPVIAANIPGLREDLEAAKAGLLFQPEDPAALAQALHRADGQPEALGEMSDRGPSFIAAERDISATVTALLEAIAQATGRRLEP